MSDFEREALGGFVLSAPRPQADTPRRRAKRIILFVRLIIGFLFWCPENPEISTDD
jgi:hypothetical protein